MSSSDYNEELFQFSSSGSSTSETFFKEDVKSCGNQVNEQWEAIERTLFQESGEQVADPELLRECKLWRETFPHFRVKGIKVDQKKQDEEADKCVQTVTNHFNLTKLNEKRESIKNKVVGQLVDRLINKFNLHKDYPESPVKGNYKSGVQITEIQDGPLEPSSLPEKSPNRLLNKSNGSKALAPVNFSKTTDMRLSSAEKESYFERGKLLESLKNIREEEEEEEEVEDLSGLTSEKVEDELYQIYDSWEEDLDDRNLGRKVETKSPTTARGFPKQNFAYPKMRNPKTENVGCKSREKSETLNKPLKPGRLPSNSFSSVAKPVEISKKIDKKYEGLLGKIMERRCTELQQLDHFRTVNTGAEMSYQEALKKLRIGSGYNDNRMNENLPKINKFKNNWLERGEINAYHHPLEDEYPLEKIRNMRMAKPQKPYRDVKKFTDNVIDDKFIEDLKREMILGYRRPPVKPELEEIRRPKPFVNLPEYVGRTQKSSSCGDLQKKSKKNTRGRQPKSGLENGKSDSNLKSRAKSTNLNKTNKWNGNKNGILPPIESSIICTELTGRPKVGPRYMPKRYI